MGSETISAVMSALAVILGMIGAMFSVKHTASSIEKTSDGDAKEAKEAAQKVQEGNKDIISLMLNNMSELRVWLNRITIRKRGPFRSSLFIFRILGCAGISL